MGQPSGEWRKSEGDEKKGKGALERKRERDLERCVLGWGVHKKYLCVCANGVGVSVLRLCGTFNVCSRAGQPRLRCQWTVL